MHENQSSGEGTVKVFEMNLEIVKIARVNPRAEHAVWSELCKSKISIEQLRIIYIFLKDCLMDFTNESLSIYSIHRD